MENAHEYSEYNRNGVTVCYTCDPLGENNKHRPIVKDWERGDFKWKNCLGEIIPKHKITAHAPAGQNTGETTNEPDK